MNSQRFASQTSVMRWANTTQCFSLFDTVLVVAKENLYYYFSLDNERYYTLVMSSETNLAERM